MSKRPGIAAKSAGGVRPIWVQPNAVAILPREVRAIKPFLTRKGSATDSTVSVSSPTAIAKVESPTGPPLNLSMRAVKTARSSRSKPFSSIFIATPLLASMREREPAMKALAKRVNARGGSPVLASTTSSVSAVSDVKRGPRNQPKRKGRK